MAGQTNDKSANKPANKRGAARLAAVQALYQMELSGATLPEIVAEYEETRLGGDIVFSWSYCWGGWRPKDH